MSESNRWMRPALEALFDSVDDGAIRAALTDESERRLLRIRLADVAGGIPDGTYADNLLMGLLALRIKFDRDMAMQKLELNLAMRSRSTR